MSKVQSCWGMILGVLVKAEVEVQTRVMLYKSDVQIDVIYCSEIWVIKNYMMKVMEGFHHHIARWITGRSVWGIGAQLWECLTVDEALDITGLWPIQ